MIKLPNAEAFKYLADSMFLSASDRHTAKTMFVRFNDAVLSSCRALKETDPTEFEIIANRFSVDPTQEEAASALYDALRTAPQLEHMRDVYNAVMWHVVIDYMTTVAESYTNEYQAQAHYDIRQMAEIKQLMAREFLVWKMLHGLWFHIDNALPYEFAEKPSEEEFADFLLGTRAFAQQYAKQKVQQSIEYLIGIGAIPGRHEITVVKRYTSEHDGVTVPTIDLKYSLRSYAPADLFPVAIPKEIFTTVKLTVQGFNEEDESNFNFYDVTAIAASDFVDKDGNVIISGSNTEACQQMLPVAIDLYDLHCEVDSCEIIVAQEPEEVAYSMYE